MPIYIVNVLRTSEAVARIPVDADGPEQAEALALKDARHFHYNMTKAEYRVDDKPVLSKHQIKEGEI